MKADELIKMWDANMEKMVASDHAAREAGRLVGRYLNFQMADGYAYYRIVRENKKSVRLQVVTDIGDDYVHPFLGEAVTLAKDKALERLEARDNWRLAYRIGAQPLKRGEKTWKRE